MNRQAEINSLKDKLRQLKIQLSNNEATGQMNNHATGNPNIFID